MKSSNKCSTLLAGNVRLGSKSLDLGHDRSWRRIQPVDATVWLNIAAGVW